MKRMYKLIWLLLSLLLMATMICGCSSESGVSFYAADRENKTAYEMQNDAETAEPQPASSSEKMTQNRKIIEYVTVYGETKAFDKLIADIHSVVEQSGGYIESSEIQGNSYLGVENRRAELKIRIPLTQKTGFSDFLSQNCNVVNQSVRTDDVTDQYIDTQSRLKALTLEKETLEKLLTDATQLSDTLTLYEKLTDVIAEIESCQSRLNQLDNLVDYTTFTVTIDEVEKETPVAGQSWFEKTGNEFMNSLSAVGDGLLTFCSFVIATVPYWLLTALVIVAVILIIRRASRKNKKSQSETKNDP